VLKKRKHGAINTEVPATVVKGYLNELILDAEQLRAQLFGLLSAAGAAPALTAGAPALTPVSDSELAKKFSALELKLLEQSRSMENVLSERNRLEKDLSEARAIGAAASGAPGADNAAIAKLQEKIRGLENKLGEYSVIEDDLANLKRLQQENAQLKSALSGKVGSGMVAIASAAPAPEAAISEALPPSQVSAAEPAAAPPTEAGFEGLVSQVEASLQPALGTEAPAAPAPAAAEGTQEKSDADLVAEFEKMLNG
jgi:hypothetical protein